jgi:hypothetical protein
MSLMPHKLDDAVIRRPFMNFFGAVIIAFVAIMVVLMVIRLGISIRSTRRMSGQGHWSADGAEIGGIERSGHHPQLPGSHHAPGHHMGGGHDMGGGHVGGGHHG